LGVFNNFPEITHMKRRFATTIANKKLQQTLVQALRETSGRTFKLEDIAFPSVHDCTATIEFGIADACSFNYLDDGETSEVLKRIRQQPFQLMDFFCAIRYYRTMGGRKTPLRFDYYLFRLVFGEKTVEMLFFHERGPRYVCPEDLENLVVAKINDKFTKKILEPF
jgi:hypothetical protein